MTRFRNSPTAFLPLALAGALLLGSLALAVPKDSAKNGQEDGGIVGGLVTDKRDDSITVQVDGEAEPTKYAIGPDTDKRTLDALKGVFTVDRVNVRYKVDGDARRVVAVEKVVGKPAGVVVGEVIKVYNDFWVAVKPKGGPPDGNALNGPAEKVKAVSDVVKALKPGDVVAIKYSTDAERHRILEIQVKPAAPAK